MSIGLILLLGLLVRLINLNQSFWLDEAAQVIESSRPLSRQFDIISDFHPPLYHLLLHFWLNFGHSEIWVRLISVIAGVISIYLIYRLGRYFGKEKTGMIAALFLALSPYHVWYSQEARPYMLFVLFSLVSTFMLIRKKWFMYSLAVVLCLYSLYFAPFLMLGHIVYVFFFERKYFRNLLISLFFSGTLFIPWMPSFIRQLERGTSGFFSGWTNIVSMVPVKAVPMTFAKFIFGKGTIDNLLIYGLITMPMFLLFLLGIWKSIEKKEGIKIIILFFVPFITAIAFSFIVPIIAPQRLIFLLPIFLLIITFGIFYLKNIWWKGLAIFIVIITSLIGLVDYYSNPYVQREQWRQAAGYVEKDGTDDSMAIFVFPQPFAPYLWYRDGTVPAIGIAPKFQIGNDDLDKLSTVLVNKNRIYLFQYLTGLTDPSSLTVSFIKSLGYGQTGIKDFPGVGLIYLFEGSK